MMVFCVRDADSFRPLSRVGGRQAGTAGSVGDDGGVFGDKAAVTGADIPVPFASWTVTVRRLPTRPVQDASPKVTLRLS